MSQDLVNKLVRRNVKMMDAYSSARDEFKITGANNIFLDANENPYNTDINRYPDPYQNKLKQALSKLKKVAVENLLLGNGSDEVLDLIFRAFCEPNRDNCITLPPTYGMYNVLANLNAVDVREVVLTEDFQLDTDAILKRIDAQTKLILICSPNNPTANTFKKSSIERLLQSFEGLIVLDEAYIDFSSKNGFLDVLDEYPNLIITQTLSKAYGAAAIRLGICYASEAIISVLNKIKPPYNINGLTQERALEQLKKTTDLRMQILEINSERKLLIQALKKIDFVETVYPSDTNFVLAKVDDADLRYKALLSAGVVVRNRSKLPLCNNCLRFTVGTPTENEALIKQLQILENK